MDLVRNGGRSTLWKCAKRAYIASERFLSPETDSLIFLSVWTGAARSLPEKAPSARS